MGDSEMMAVHFGPRVIKGPRLGKRGVSQHWRCFPPVFGSKGSKASSLLAPEQLKVISSTCKLPEMAGEAAGHKYSTSEKNKERVTEKRLGKGRQSPKEGLKVQNKTLQRQTCHL
jgi:hypothetical protein